MHFIRLSALFILFSASWVQAQTFYSMNFSETNMRTGNSTTHPVLAVYGQRGTPFEILSILYPDKAYKEGVDEQTRLKNFTPSWYRVRDFEGQTGWIKSNQLGRKKTLIIANAEQATMYAEANHHEAIALLPKNLVVSRIQCQIGWCQIRFNDAEYGELEGWVSQDYLWGDMKAEPKKP